MLTSIDVIISFLVPCIVGGLLAFWLIPADWPLLSGHDYGSRFWQVFVATLSVAPLVWYEVCFATFLFNRQGQCTCQDALDQCSEWSCRARNIWLGLISCPFSSEGGAVVETIPRLVTAVVLLLWQLSCYIVVALVIVSVMRYIDLTAHGKLRLVDWPKALAKIALWLLTARNELVRQACEEKIRERLACVACTERERDCCLGNCGHVCICMECSSRLQACPMCRQDISYRVKCYI